MFTGRLWLRLLEGLEMPIGLHSEQTVKIWLRSDMFRPEADRPTFHARFLTPVRQDELESAILSAADLPDDKARRLALATAALIGLKRVEKFTDELENQIPLTAQNLADNLLLMELADLAWQCHNKPNLEAADFFQSGWPWELQLKSGAGPADASATPPTNAK
jgi:hypothetical protein